MSEVEEPYDYESLPTNSLATFMIAGAIAGTMEHCVVYPLDLVKTRMQCMVPSPEAHYRGVVHALRQIMRTEGRFRPLRGMSAMMIGCGPAHALYFSCYEHVKIAGKKLPSSYQPLIYGLAGALSTLLHDSVMVPSEVVKQRMQVYGSPYRGVLDCLLSIYRKEGLRAFYRSYTTQLAMNVPFQAIHILCYEKMQDLVNPHRDYAPASHLLSGGVAGAVAAATTNPLDVCKTLLNTQEGCCVNQLKCGTSCALNPIPQAVLSDRPIEGMTQAFKTVYRVSGVRGFFRGVSARVLFQVPGTAVSWAVYEFFKSFLMNKEVPIDTLSNGDSVALRSRVTPAIDHLHVTPRLENELPYR